MLFKQLYRLVLRFALICNVQWPNILNFGSVPILVLAERNITIWRRYLGFYHCVHRLYDTCEMWLPFRGIALPHSPKQKVYHHPSHKMSSFFAMEWYWRCTGDDGDITDLEWKETFEVVIRVAALLFESSSQLDSRRVPLLSSELLLSSDREQVQSHAAQTQKTHHRSR